MEGVGNSCAAIIWRRCSVSIIQFTDTNFQAQTGRLKIAWHIHSSQENRQSSNWDGIPKGCYHKTSFKMSPRQFKEHKLEREVLGSYNYRHHSQLVGSGWGCSSSVFNSECQERWEDQKQQGQGLFLGGGAFGKYSILCYIPNTIYDTKSHNS